MKRNLLSETFERPPGMKLAVWEDCLKGLQLFEKASENIVKAGKIFADIPEPQWLKFEDNAPSGYKLTLRRIRDVGKGTIIPQLATASGSYVSKLRSFCLEDQERFMIEPIEVAVTVRGEPDKRLERVPEMEPETIKQVFGNEGRPHGKTAWFIRDVDEQRAWLDLQAKQAEKKPSKPEVRRPGKWSIRDGKVFLTQKKAQLGLTRADIEALMADLTSS